MALTTSPWGSTCDRSATARTRPPQSGAYRGWGFKEPNTHVFLEHLAVRFEGWRYLYVLRHGLDMACSNNVAQLRSWGARYGVAPPGDERAVPSAQLEFSLRATDRAIKTGRLSSFHCTKTSKSVHSSS